MEEVTDVAFREMFARCSVPIHGLPSEADKSARYTTGRLQPNPFVMYTEFINVDGLLHPEGFKKLSIDLKFTENQHPIVAQLWGTDPEKFERAAALVAEMGFDGVDINMGCPQDKEIGIGACAALIRQPELAKQIIRATKKGAGKLPVSVKTRIGYTKNELEIKEQIERSLDQLDPKYREPLVLYYIEGFDYKEIAEILRIPTATVGVRLNRGKKILKDKYDKLVK